MEVCRTTARRLAELERNLLNALTTALATRQDGQPVRPVGEFGHVQGYVRRQLADIEERT